jgi:hypothetical protein
MIKDLRISYQEADPGEAFDKYRGQIQLKPEPGDETLWIFSPAEGCSVSQANMKLRGLLARKLWHWYPDRQEWEAAPVNDALKVLSNVFPNCRSLLERERLLHRQPEEVQFQIEMFRS